MLSVSRGVLSTPLGRRKGCGRHIDQVGFGECSRWLGQHRLTQAACAQALEGVPVAERCSCKAKTQAEQDGK